MPFDLNDYAICVNAEDQFGIEDGKIYKVTDDRHFYQVIATGRRYHAERFIKLSDIVKREDFVKRT